MSLSFLKLMSIESMMPSNHLILCCPLPLPPSIFPSIKVFSNELALRIKWPKYWSFSISPCNEYSGLISFRIDWFNLLAVQGTLKSLFQHHNSRSINSYLLGITHQTGVANFYLWILPTIISGGGGFLNFEFQQDLTLSSPPPPPTPGGPTACEHYLSLQNCVPESQCCRWTGSHHSLPCAYFTLYPASPEYHLDEMLITFRKPMRCQETLHLNVELHTTYLLMPFICISQFCFLGW